ncbi:MAG: AAA family ATPase [Planctomycetota bacterium]
MQREQEPVDTVSLRVIREPAYVPMSPRKHEVCWNFGIPPREEPFVIGEDLSIELRPGAVVMLTGPSGSGKTSLLHAAAERAGRAVWVGRGRFPTDRAIVDAIAPRKTLATALDILTACGLGEPRLWVREFSDLSDGEQFRVSLARAVGRSLDARHPTPIFCDEFTAILHRRMAKAVAYNLRKLVSRHRLMLVVATTHDDVIADLQPDQVIRLGAAIPQVARHQVRDKPPSLRRHATIVPGSVRDYRIFGPMHYRHRDGLGFVDKVFVLKESPRGEPLGILVFAHAPMELALRNRSTAGRFTRNVRRLNRELRILRRLVMHPDVRGCGLGHWFVENTLPQVGVRFVECLAAMGAVNPVFERAGMQRIGRCPLPRGRMELLRRLRKWDIDPFSPEFSRKIARYPRLRKLIEETIKSWVDRTQGTAKYRVEGRPPITLARAFRQIIGEPPIYYLWDKRGEYPKHLETVEQPQHRGGGGAREAKRGDCRSDGRKKRSAARGRDRHDPANASPPRRGAARSRSSRQ